ncbi:hypothetical protein BLS_005489 [Venturia inaequalis]|uniref:Heterokaryon incompatibility domain-containing protein n=1 Tax=Venturia inaequalis TaxID=5025 RepID=A0A8H3V832_VENIN|nr:hypothetical protein BLS_005489 [Venturia inaequalis]KAE9982849.1 hypothetical protein EG328_010588 [Venturia inaequalis]
MTAPLLNHVIPPDCSICQRIIDAFTAPSSKPKNPFVDEIVAHGPLLLKPCAGHGLLFAGLIQDAGQESFNENMDSVYLKMDFFGQSPVTTFGLHGRGIYLRREYMLLKTDMKINQSGCGKLPNRNWIDSGLPKLWKEECLKHHGDECERPLKRYTIPNTTPTWLVDVYELRLVSGRPELPYVALSYRWGQTAGLRLQNASIVDFQKSFTLPHLDNRIPHTIRNAMDVVKLLGERYLWVDTLCISQDDTLTKSREIDLMGAYYANAIVTIVAADGEDADYGLRGFEGLSQKRDLDLDALAVDFGKEYKLVNTDIGYGEGKWACSPYFKRAWVFQEYNFSKRRLVFHNQMVRWECCCSKWQEAIEHLDDPQTQFPHAFSSVVEGGHPALSMCTELIGDYNEREFTYNEDALPAVTGLLTVLGQKFLGGFLFGLPVMFFEAALNWNPKTYHGPHEMTRRLPTLNKTGVSQPCLPSWSWIGWEGRIEEYVADDDFNFYATDDRIYTIPITKWFTAASQSELKRHVDSWFLRDRDRLKDHFNQPLPPGWTRDTSEAETALLRITISSHSHVECGKVIPGGMIKKTMIEPPEGCGGAIYRHESCAEYKFWYPIPLPTPGQPAISPPQTAQLFCETHRFFFNTESLPPENYERGLINPPMVCLYTATSGQFAGVLFCQNKLDLQDLMAKKTVDEKVEVVATSRGYRHETARQYSRMHKDFWVRCDTTQAQGEQDPEDTVLVEFKEWYNVLWVEWVDGVAYRRCFGQILKDVWEALELEPISLVLG